jgi:hypothetical protein
MHLHGGTHNVVHLALASSGALMLMVALLRWIDAFSTLWSLTR